MFQLKTILLLLACILSLCAPAGVIAAEGGENVAAKVGNIAITHQEVQREMQKIIPMNVSYHGGVSDEKIKEVKDKALQVLIERAYKVQYAIAEEIAVDPKLMEEKWQAFYSKYDGQLAKMPASLVESYRVDIYRSLLAQKAEAVAVEEKINVSEAEIQKYYESNKEHYFQPKLYTASQVFVRVDPASRQDQVTERRQHATKLLERARAGEDFYNLAYYESDDRSKYVGGSLGSFHAGQTVQEFDAALDELAPGDISDLVRTMYGFHIIKLDDVQDARQLSYEEAAPAIKKLLEKSQRDGLTQQWMDANREKFPLQKFE